MEVANSNFSDGTYHRVTVLVHQGVQVPCSIFSGANQSSKKTTIPLRAEPCPPNSCLVVPTLVSQNVTVFADKAFEKVIELK